MRFKYGTHIPFLLVCLTVIWNLLANMNRDDNGIAKRDAWHCGTHSMQVMIERVPISHGHTQ